MARERFRRCMATERMAGSDFLSCVLGSGGNSCTSLHEHEQLFTSRDLERREAAAFKRALFFAHFRHGFGYFYFASKVALMVHHNGNGGLTDKFGRQITDLRISVTDRCNFRCVYCRSANPENHVAEHKLLSWNELERLAQILVSLGICKVRVTGGEPLVRPGVEKFISALREMGVQDLSLTTNGQLLAERCEHLVVAGLNRINISLDSLDRAKFEKITRTKSFDRVIAGIDAAQASLLRPVKVNAVLVRGINDDEVERFAEFARERDLIIRFIEFMPLDADRTWTRDLMVPAAEVKSRIEARWPLLSVAHERSETARKYRFADGRGEIGLIAPVTQPFCGFCSRIRLTAEGKLRTCLFSKDDHDLQTLLRSGADDGEIAAQIRTVVMGKEAGHRINEPDFVPPSRTMVYIGG